jgi:hypothetical protein
MAITEPSLRALAQLRARLRRRAAVCRCYRSWPPQAWPVARPFWRSWKFVKAQSGLLVDISFLSLAA